MPGKLKAAAAEPVEVLSTDVLRRLTPRLDCVRLHGEGEKMFRVSSIGRSKDGTREWLDTYGPLDEYGFSTTKHAKYRPVTFDAVKAKVRNPPPVQKGRTK